MTKQKPNDNDFFDFPLINDENFNPELIDSLQSEIAELKDKRREDWFLFIVIIVILLNILFFENLGIAAFAILILECLVIIPLARRMGVDEIKILYTQLAERVAGKLEK
ncbi:MAG: hypothetical protein K0U39_01130 [Alphaproteobacteria bacterium]|nr:hypothetical protein [Alphaproteobacteria bacterium]